MQYIGEHGIVRPRDIEAVGLPRQYLVRLHHQGKLKRPGRGIYTLADAKVTERHSYAEIAKRVPKAAICLLSALAFHEITTQNPASVWIALPKGARKPALDSPSLRIVRLSGLSLTNLLNSSRLRFFGEDVRSGILKGRVIEVMSLVRDSSASRPERERILNTAPQEPATGG